MSDKNLFDDENFGAEPSAGAKKPKNVFDDDSYGADPGLLRSVGDTAIAAGSGVLTGAQLIANAAGAGNNIAKGLGKASDAVRSLESGGRRAERDARGFKIQQAEDSGSTWEEIKANVGAFTEAPIDTTVEALGTSVPSIAAAALARRNMGPASGTAAGAAVGGVQGAGAVKGSIYDTVEQEYLKAGATPEEAAARADAAQAYSGDNAGMIGLGAGLGVLAGSTGIEGAVGRMVGREAAEDAAQGIVRSTLMGAAKEAPMEAMQGGQERLAANLALQNEGFNAETWKGVAGAAALEGIAGAAGGGAFGLAEGAMARREQPTVDLLNPDAPADAAPTADGFDPSPSVGPSSADLAAQSGVAPSEPIAPEAPVTPAPVAEAQPTAAPVAPAPAPAQPATPAEQMGIDANAGPLSAGAALAVNSGVSGELAMQAEAQAVAEAQAQAAKQKPQQAAKPVEQPLTQAALDLSGVNPETGEIMTPARTREVDRAPQTPVTEEGLRERLQFLREQAKSSGWNKALMSERTRIEGELAKISAARQSDEAKEPEATAAPASSAATAITTEAAPAEPDSDIRKLIAKQIPQMTDAELSAAVAHYGPSHKRTAKLNKEIEKRAAAGSEGSGQPIWSGLSNEQRAKVLAQHKAWSTGKKAGDALNIIGKKLAKTDWAKIPATTRATIERMMDKADIAAKVVTPEPAVAETATAPAATSAPIERAAAEAATSEANDLPAPTEAQIEAGNYKKGHVKVNGHDISIENPAGSRRRPEWPPLANHYGYIRGTVGKDKDHVDVFMTDRADDASLPVFVVDQNNRDGSFDEHKVVMGAADEAEARSTYLANYEKGWTGLGGITQMTQDEFKSWVRDPAKTTKPAATQADDTESTTEPRGVVAKVKAKAEQDAESAAQPAERESEPVEAASNPAVSESKPPIPASEPAIPASRAPEQSTDLEALGFELPEGVALSANQIEEIKAGDVGLAGELEPRTIQSLAAMRDNPNVPVMERSRSGVGYTGKPEYIDLGSGYKARGYIMGDSVTQQILLPNGMEVSRTLDGNGRLSGMFAGDYEQIVEGKGIDEAYKLFSDFAEMRKQREATPKLQDSTVVIDRSNEKSQFADNKIFTADAVAKARERMRKKLGQINSGIDPEMLIDGMTVAGAYIESGVRSFADYAKAMVDDMGDGIKPYLLSFWEGARSYPGLDTTGMTSAEDSAREFSALTSLEQATEVIPDAIGKVEAAPAKRTKKTGARGDMTLTQDWGVEHIDGYGDSTRETGNDTKDAFLKEARNYLSAVADALKASGFEPHLDRKGKPEKPVSVNESGVAGSGDVSLTLRHTDSDVNVYITIGDTSLRGVVPSTKSGIAIMYRASSGADRYATKGGNTWAPVELTANELADLVSAAAIQAEKTNARTVQTEKLPAERASSPQENAAPGNRDRESLDDGLAGQGDSADRGERVPASTDGAGEGRARGVQQSGEQSPGAPRDSGTLRTERSSAGSVADPATAETSPKPELDTDFTVDADSIGTGGLTAKYRDNIAAIKILKAMTQEGRKATAEERRKIARYVGWGALKGVFDKDNKQWAQQYTELKELLTEDEYKAARASVLNAHYTSPTIINGIFSALDALGFKHGRVSEPSVGVGNFFGMMPASMRKASQLHGVELDVLTSQIVAALYPSAKIAQSTGFQDYDVPSGYFDVAIGNPPFGNEPIVDDARSPYSGFSIHNYFFAKSIDKLRPGGLLTMVVSHSFLDARNSAARKWIAKHADLVSAVRLPRTAFKENAGTEVVTDIVILQKRAPGVESVSDAWVETGSRTLLNPKTGEDHAHTISQYFIDNPQNVLGVETAAGSMYRANEYTVEPTPAAKLDEQVAAWVKTLPQGVYEPIERTHEDEAADVSIPDGVKVGSFFVNEDGSISQRDPDVMGNRAATQWVPPNAKAAERMVGMIELRDALRHQMRIERSTETTDDEVEAARINLNALYDSFRDRFGFVNDATNRRIFLDDTESALLLALEFDYDRGVSRAVAEREGIEPRAASAVKADIFNRRVLFPPAENIKVSNAHDAMLASLNYKGRLDMDYMVSLYDKPAADIVRELGDAVYNDPLKGYVMADEYLSGDVKTKLDEAQEAAKDNSDYARNVEALKKVIPVDKKPSEIHASMGAAFIPAEYFQDFAKQVTGADVTATYVRATGQWLITETGRADPVLNISKWGIERMPATEIFRRTMAGQGVVVTQTTRNGDGSTTTTVLETETAAAREKQSAMRAEWQRWLWADADRADRIAQIYNDTMNRVVVRKYDGSHLTFPGMSPAMSLLPHQKNAVWRGLQSGQVLFDHVVGAGKTFEVVALFMEMRRLGIARKPFIAVPNHLTLQWRSEFSRLYPAANVLAATPDDFAKGNREKFFSKIVTGDWDAVIVGHSSLKKIALPPETEKAVLEEQISELASAIEETKRARGDRNIVRDMENIKARLEGRMKERLQALGNRDKVLTFDELGVDAFAVDELHEFKNLFYNSTMERVPGMGNPSGSDKAFDLFVKLQWMYETFGDKAPIVGATGTPVSNSLVEMFNMQRFLQYPSLKAEGLHVFDAWAKQFGSVESLYEVSPSGTGYRQSSRFAKFKNLPALMAHYGTFADTVTLDDLKAQELARGKSFPVPKVAGGRPSNIVAKRSPVVADFMGVPELAMKDGAVEFAFDASTDTMTIDQSSDKTHYMVHVHRANADGEPQTFLLGTAKTEEDARLQVIEAALTPKIHVPEESILGQFGRLKELTRQTKGKVNALSLTGQANKAGLDYRLIDPTAQDFPGSKINLAVDRVVSNYKRWNKAKGTQLVFCDLSVPLSAKSGFSNKERRVYVIDKGALAHKKGTLHTIPGQEQLPFLVVKEGKEFAVFDAASGLRLHSGVPSKALAIDWAAVTMADDAKLQRWIDARDRQGDLEQDAIDDYNNANEIDTENTEAISLADIAGSSGSAKFSVYDDIKAKLIKKGIPEREIAFIHDYSTPAAKDKLFKAVNAGTVRVLLGSTPKMGAGTNVQKRLVALHHIDAPWRPSDLEQREGRIIRRGNELYEADPEGFEVEIYRYATEQTYDTRRWQILEHKARGIEQLRNYDGTLNEIDDIEGEAANSADMKAAASGDPLILEETQLRNEVRRLEALQASHADEKQAMLRRARNEQRYAQELGPRDLAELQRLKAAAEEHPVTKDVFVGVTVGGRTFTDRDQGIAAIRAAIGQVLSMGGSETFTYRGVDFTLDGNGVSADLSTPTGQLDRFRSMDALPSAAGFLTRFANYVTRLDSHIVDTQARIRNSADQAKKLLEQSKSDFAQAEELNQARENHTRVQRRLIAKGPDIPAEQRPILEKALERQRQALKDLGMEEALNEFLGSNADQLRYSFAGQGAQGADVLALKTARIRLARGEDADIVRQETGWHMGVDGKWRFEISDHQADLAVDGRNADEIIDLAGMGASLDGRTHVTVSDVLDHPQLFAAYPGLAKIRLVAMDETERAKGRVRNTARGPEVQLNPKLRRDEVTSVLLHEFQHLIQHQEGWARGGSRKAFASELDPTGRDTYRRLAGEVEARNTQARMSMSPEMRQAFAPELTADIEAKDVIVMMNGKVLKTEFGPMSAEFTADSITEQDLKRSFAVRFPRLAPALKTMLERGKSGKRGGVVLIESSDPAVIAQAYAQKTGTSLSAAVQLFEGDGKINGFYDAKSGLTFLVGGNLNARTAPAVLLHEMTHSQQRKAIDDRAAAMIANRDKVKDADLRAFLNRVATVIDNAGETGNTQEAAAYIVELAVSEGRSSGYALADNRFLSWVDSTIGKPVGDLIRAMLKTVRQFMLSHNLGLKDISVDDLVEYAMAGMERTATGSADRGNTTQFSAAGSTDSAAFKRWFGESQTVSPNGKPIVFYRGQNAAFNDDGLSDRYFTSDPEYASEYALDDITESESGGPNVLPVFIRANKVKFESDHSKVTDWEYDRSQLLSEGYDAVATDDFQIIVPLKDDAQIKSATGNNGDFDPSNPDIRFSRSGIRAIASRATAELNRTFSAPNKLSMWHKTMGTMYNLSRLSPAFRRVFESAQGFIDDVAHYASDAAELAPKLLPRLETWKDIAKSPISAEDNKAIAAPIFEGTLSWRRGADGKPVRIDDLEREAATMSTDDKVSRLLAADALPVGMLKAWQALPASQFEKMIDSRYQSTMMNAGIVWTESELKGMFNLTDSQVGLYKEFRESIGRSLDTMARSDMLRYAGEDVKHLRDVVMDATSLRAAASILHNELNKMAIEQPGRANMLLASAHGISERVLKVEKLLAEGYAPLSRFGKYTVDVVGEGGREYFGLFETQREANLMAEQMRAEYGAGAVSQGTLSDESYKLFAGVTPETLELFGSALGFDAQGDSAQDQAFQEYLRLTKTNRSAMRRLIHRKGVAGFSQDVGRVLASFVYSNARQTAAGLHMGDLSEAVESIPKEQGELKDAAVRLAEYIKNPQEEAAPIKNLLFAQYLGGSVASAFVNMTQPAAVTFPWLSQFGGAKKAAVQITKAARQVFADKSSLEPDLARALTKAELDGVVSPQEVHQLMAQARGSGSLRAGDGSRVGDVRALAANSLTRFSVGWGKLFGAAEQVNRRITYVAAYRTAVEQGMADPDAFARDAVRETQFVYSKASRMQWGRGAVGGVLLTFKTYSVAYLELMYRLWNQGEPGSQERREGRKAAALMVLAVMVMGGMGGLPFMEDAEDLIDAAAQMMGYNFSSKKAREQFIIDMVGPELAHVLDKGVSGLPGSPMDVSGRLGMGNLIPGTSLLQKNSSGSRDAAELAGPIGDLASRFVSGTKQVLSGNVGAGLLEMSPVAIRNAAKGADMAVHDMYRDTKGYKVLDSNNLEAALKGMGFQPAGVARVQEANWLNQRAKSFYNMRAQEIRAMWAAGVFEKDPAKVQRARDAVAEWNLKNPDQPMTIKIPDVMRRVREMSKTKDQRIADTAPRAMRARMQQEAAELRTQLE